MTSKEYKEKIKTRDLRRKDKFQVDDLYLNGYAKLCGIYATGAYCSLCRHANYSTQECWPSIEKISEELSISRPSVLKGIKSLERWGIIRILKEKDEKTKRQKNNIYLLVDKSEWKPKPETRVNDIDPEKQKAESTTEQSRVNDIDSTRVNDVDCKVTNNKGDKDEGIATETVADPINQIFEVFYKSVNPTINFGNKTQRKAAQDLIDKLGIEQTLKAAKYAVSLSGKDYAPEITNPLELKNKIGHLVSHYKKNNRSNCAIV